MTVTSPVTNSVTTSENVNVAVNGAVEARVENGLGPMVGIPGLRVYEGSSGRWGIFMGTELRVHRRTLYTFRWLS